MAKKKEEAKYIGRYGEVLDSVREITDTNEIKKFASKFKITPKRRFMEGVGLNKFGDKAYVRFVISKETGKKEGLYAIVSKVENHEGRYYEALRSFYNTFIEESVFQNDVLHGSERHYYTTNNKKLNTELADDTVYTTVWRHGTNIGAAGISKRKDVAKEVKSLLKLFSDASVKEAVETGNIFKVKRAMTRAVKKKEMGE